MATSSAPASAANSFAALVVTYTAKLVLPDASIHAAEQAALVNIFVAPMYEVSPHIARDVGALGARIAPQKAPWACRLRVVVRHTGLVLDMHRLDAAISEEHCLVPRFRELLAASCIADLRVAHAHALGLPANILLAFQAVGRRGRRLAHRPDDRPPHGALAWRDNRCTAGWGRHQRVVRTVFSQVPFAVAFEKWCALACLWVAPRPAVSGVVPWAAMTPCVSHGVGRHG